MKDFAPGGAPLKIAVIGAGVSGLAAANAIANRHRVTLIEAEPRLGGHARTVVAGKRGDRPVDTGFIVFNRANYPKLTELFARLEVPVIPSDMSFGVSANGGAVEYALRNLGALFAQQANLCRPAFHRMVLDILRFNARALEAAEDESLTVGGLIERLRLGPWFRDYYLLPISGAIWSTPPARMLEFPAWAMMRFFENHALLSASGQHQWYTVSGGSVEYVRRIEARLRRKRVELRTGQAVQAVRREPAAVRIKMHGGEWERFDEVVLATHSDDSLRLLADATPTERDILSAIAYQPNEVVLHADSSVMPRRRKAWASWVYTDDGLAPRDRIGVTYWMNSLQAIPADDPLFVTLNGARPIRDDLIYDTATFRHPVFDAAALRAQRRLRAANGANGTWFCGAWTRNGFHEDGLTSGLAVADRINRDATYSVAAE